MRTQTVRKITLFTGFVLFQIPMVHLLFSPVLAVAGARQGIVAAALVTYGALAAASLVFGRAYCGWCCDGAAIQECCTALGARRVRGRRFWTKYVVFGLWLALVAAGFLQAGVHRVDLGFGAHTTVAARPFVLLYGPFLIHVPLTLLLGRWAFCHYGCWIAPFLVLGTRLKERMSWPSLRIAADAGACIQCDACAVACPMSLDVPGMVAAGALRSGECVLCGTCVDACATGAVRFTFAPATRSRTPLRSPLRQSGSAPAAPPARL